MEIKLNLIGGFFWEVQSSRHDGTKLSIKFLSLFRFFKKKKKENESRKLWILKKKYPLDYSLYQIFNFEWTIIVAFYFYLIVIFKKKFQILILLIEVINNNKSVKLKNYNYKPLRYIKSCNYNFINFL